MALQATIATGAALLLLLGVGGCSRQPPRRAGSGALPSGSISWPAVAGAQRYVVRGWSGHQLLFEITTADTTLQLTPSMARAIAAFDSASAEILAQGGAHAPGRVVRPLWPRPASLEDGAGGGT